MPKVRLGDICEIVSGSTPKSNIPEYWNGDLEWITPAELSEDSFYIFSSVRHITGLGVKKTSLKPFPAGTVILSSRAPIGKVAIAGNEMYCNQGFKNLICSEKVFNEYLYFFLRGQTEHLNSLGRGATFKEISKSIVENIEVPLPSFEVQRQIASKMRKSSELISLRKQQLSELDVLVKSQFAELFGDPVTNPLGWDSYPLQKLLDIDYITYHLDGNHGGDYPRSEEFVDSGVPYISANCIINGEIDFAFAKHLKLERANRLRKGIAQNNDVLFAHNATVGPVALLRTSEPKVILGTSLIAYRCNRQILNPCFLKAYMESEAFIKQYSADMKQTTRNQVPMLTQRKYIFWVPPLAIQNKFAAFVQQADKSKNAIQNSLVKFETLKKALMQQFFG
jgi:type I restriction enzyme S subunit